MYSVILLVASNAICFHPTVSNATEINEMEESCDHCLHSIEVYIVLNVIVL